MSTLLLKEYFNELTDVRYTKETTAALTQGLFTFGSAVQVERQIENQNSKILFTSDEHSSMATLVNCLLSLRSRLRLR